MNRLFVIGNGFDIAHKLPTRYYDFKKYIDQNYSDSTTHFWTVPKVREVKNGDEYYSKGEVASFIVAIVSMTEKYFDEWKDFENSLGKLNYSSYFSVDDKLDSIKQEKKIIKIVESIVTSLGEIPKIFDEWIKSINLEGINEIDGFGEYIKPDQDIFLTFNYTNTLEYLYSVQNINYIHGKSNTDKLIFGHNNEKLTNLKLFQKYPKIKDSFEEIRYFLKKDTEEVLKSNKDFFEKDIINVKKIFFYGFSFSDVDMIYFKKIFEVLDTSNISLYIYDYFESKDELKAIKEKLKKTGFDGEFKDFNL